MMKVLRGMTLLALTAILLEGATREASCQELGNIEFIEQEADSSTAPHASASVVGQEIPVEVKRQVLLLTQSSSHGGTLILLPNSNPIPVYAFKGPASWSFRDGILVAESTTQAAFNALECSGATTHDGTVDTGACEACCHFFLPDTGNRNPLAKRQRELCLSLCNG